MSALNRRLHHRWIATWLAVFGLVFAPTLSKAMAALGGGTDWVEWVEVCSSDANRRGPLVGNAADRQTDDAAAAKAQLHQQTSHCPLCGVVAGGLGLPPAPFALWLGRPEARASAFPARPMLADPTPRTRPQPRAPPLLA